MSLQLTLSLREQFQSCLDPCRLRIVFLYSHIHSGRKSNESVIIRCFLASRPALWKEGILKHESRIWFKNPMVFPKYSGPQMPCGISEGIQTKLAFITFTFLLWHTAMQNFFERGKATTLANFGISNCLLLSKLVIEHSIYKGLVIYFVASNQSHHL